MKKSLVLGAAALATLLMAAPQDSQAGEVKMGGYYMFRVQDSDSAVATAAGASDDIRAGAQRLQLNMDFIQDKTTHAHLVTRILDTNYVQGADLNSAAGNLNGQVRAGGSSATGDGSWNIRKVWLETDMWGVGVKVGNMPISLNDNILVSSNDDTGYGALMLSKTFGDVSVALADVRVMEGNISGFSASSEAAWDAATAATAAGTNTAAQDALLAAYPSRSALGQGANEDNEDLYVLALFGKVNQVNYGVTGAYLKTGDASVTSSYFGNANQDVSDGWIGLTLNTVLGGVDVTATGIYETGMSGVNRGDRAAAKTALDGAAADGSDAATLRATARKAIATERADDNGFLGALRLKGDLPGLAQGATWNAYGVWAAEGFNNITNDEMGWSQTWDMGGPGAQDLMKTWAVAAGASASENIRSVGVGVKVPVQGWTINPMIDYAQTSSNDTLAAGEDYRTSSAWGGALQVSTKLNAATTFAVTGIVVDPNDEGMDALGAAQNKRDLNGTGATDTMHTVEATLKMTF